MMPIAGTFSIYMLLSNSTPHDSCIPYCPISSTLKPNFFSPCMFTGHLHKNFHSTQCIMSIFLTLICMHMSKMMTNQPKNGGILPLLFPINIFTIKRFHIIIVNWNNGGSICSCPPWKPTIRFLSFIISDTFYRFLLSIIDIISSFASLSEISTTSTSS